MTRSDFIKLLWEFESNAFKEGKVEPYRLKLIEVYEKAVDNAFGSINAHINPELFAARAVVDSARAGRKLGNGGMTETEYQELERALDFYDKVVDVNSGYSFGEVGYNSWEAKAKRNFDNAQNLFSEVTSLRNEVAQQSGQIRDRDRYVAELVELLQEAKNWLLTNYPEEDDKYPDFQERLKKALKFAAALDAKPESEEE